MNSDESNFNILIPIRKWMLKENVRAPLLHKYIFYNENDVKEKKQIE